MLCFLPVVLTHLFLIFFFPQIFSFLFFVCLQLFLVKVVDLAVPRWKWLRFGIYNAIVWGLAFLCMVIPASAGYINFAPGGT